MLVKCHEHLYPLVRLDRNCVDQDIFEYDCNLDIFQQIASTNEPGKELVKKKLLIFKRYQLDVKDIKCCLQWWQKHEAMFPTCGFLTQQILSVIGSQIETERIFSFIGILTNLRKFCLQTENLKKLILSTKTSLMILEQIVSFHLTQWNSLKGMQIQKRSLKSLKVNLKGIKLLKCKTSINKTLFNVKKLFVTMFVIFSLVRKIMKSNFFLNLKFDFLEKKFIITN